MESENSKKSLQELEAKHGLTRARFAKRIDLTLKAVKDKEAGIDTPNQASLNSVSKQYTPKKDELVAQINNRADIIPKENTPNWFYRLYLFPIVLIVLSFGLSQFYFFLNQLYAMIIVAVVFGVIFSFLMNLIKVRNRGHFYLIVLGILLAINGTLYLTNKNYFNLMEVPYLQETERVSSEIDNTNYLPTSLSYLIGEEPKVLMFHEGVKDIQLFDIDGEISTMMTQISTLDQPVMSVAILGSMAYFSSYESGDDESTIYQLNLVTHEVGLLLQENQRFDLVASDTTLYLVVLGDILVDYADSVYLWNGSTIELVAELDFEIVDIEYNESFDSFFIAVNRNIDDDYAFGNILIYDELFDFQAQVFDEDVSEYFDLKSVGMHVISSYDSEIIDLLYDEVEYTGLYGTTEGFHDSGNYYVLHGDLINPQWIILSQNSFYLPNWQPSGAQFIYWRASSSDYVAIDGNDIILLQNYSQQISELMIPSYWRHGIFFSVMPMIALVIALGTTLTDKSKKVNNKTINDTNESAKKS